MDYSEVDEDLIVEDELDEEVGYELPIPFVSVLAPEGKPTGDGRQFSVGALTHRDLPLPVMYQRIKQSGHDGAVAVGIISEIFRHEESGTVRARGFFNPNIPEIDEVIDGLVFGSIRGISVDLDDVDGEMQTSDSGGQLELYTKARIVGATIVAIPAFQEAYLALGDLFDDEVSDEAIAASAAPSETDYDCGCETDDEAEFAPGTRDGRGWITHPKETQRLRRYWTRGEGAAKIRWGQPGDFNRCRRQLAKYVNPAFLAGTCANLHKVAIGIWPGQHRRGASLETSDNMLSLTAAAPLNSLPKDWFENPKLTGPTSLKITEEGRVYGHLAAWGVCHIGIPNVCVTAPVSKSNYAYFHTGVVDTSDGPVNVGSLTMSIGHPSTNVSAAAATAHYDRSDAVFADVVMGEDAYGIWFAGAVRGGVDENAIRELRATAKMSGDWRPIRGNLELVGAVAVGVPGFPIPEPRFSVQDGQQIGLVAAGIVTDEQYAEDLSIAREVFTQIENEEQLALVASARELLLGEN